jgi:beta,beta-carotene 9',10'-dioxygenase
VVIDHPLRFSPISMLFSNRPLAEHFVWTPETGTKLWRLDRTSGQWTGYETDALFCFHVVNAFEDGADTVLDFLAYEDASVVGAARVARLADGVVPLLGRYVRARLRPGATRVQLESLSHERFEFPNIAHRAQSGRRYDVAWGAQLAPASWSSSIVRLDTANGDVRRHGEQDITFGEPVFVPRPGAERATEGVVLTVGSHAREDRALLEVLDADSLEPLARCTLPLALPLGFHGNFRPKHGASADCTF